MEIESTKTFCNSPYLMEQVGALSERQLEEILGFLEADLELNALETGLGFRSFRSDALDIIFQHTAGEIIEALNLLIPQDRYVGSNIDLSYDYDSKKKDPLTDIREDDKKYFKKMFEREWRRLEEKQILNDLPDKIIKAYEILGIRATQDIEGIKKAYREGALALHPDRVNETGLSDEEAHLSFLELKSAFDLVMGFWAI